VNFDVVFTVNGRRYELAPTDTLTFGEQRTIKRVSGVTAPDLDNALYDMDQDAWFALLLVSMRRQRPETSEEELETADFVEVMEPIGETMRAQIKARIGEGEDDAGPPSVAGEANAEPSQPQTETTPAHSGVL
jgi:hypothetical protein